MWLVSQIFGPNGHSMSQFILTGQMSLGWRAHVDHGAARFRVKAALPLVQPLRQHMEMRPSHWPHPHVLPVLPGPCLFQAWEGLGTAWGRANKTSIRSIHLNPIFSCSCSLCQLRSGSKGELATCDDSWHCGEELFQWIGMCLVFECQLWKLVASDKAPFGERTRGLRTLAVQKKNIWGIWVHFNHEQYEDPSHADNDAHTFIQTLRFRNCASTNQGPCHALSGGLQRHKLLRHESFGSL